MTPHAVNNGIRKAESHPSTKTPSMAKRFSLCFSAAALVEVWLAFWLPSRADAPLQPFFWLGGAIACAFASVYFYRVSLGITTDIISVDMSANQVLNGLRALGLGKQRKIGQLDPTAIQQLMTILPLLDGSYADRVTLELLHAMRRFLDPHHVESTPYLVAEIIKALARIEDGGAYPRLLYLSQENLLEPVQGIVNRTLPDFERLYRQSGETRALLRPVNATERNDTLLRVPISEDRIDQAQLLRPATPGELF